MKKKFHINIRQHLYDRLEQAKEETGVPMVRIIEDAIEYYLDAHQVGEVVIGFPAPKPR